MLQKCFCGVFFVVVVLVDLHKINFHVQIFCWENHLSCLRETHTAVDFPLATLKLNSGSIMLLCLSSPNISELKIYGCFHPYWTLGPQENPSKEKGKHQIFDNAKKAWLLMYACPQTPNGGWKTYMSKIIPSPQNILKKKIPICDNTIWQPNYFGTSCHF